MSQLPGAESTIVGRTRVSASADGAFVLRRRVEGALDAVDAARVVGRRVLIVRNVHGRLATGAHASGRFGELTRDALSAHRDRAARPGPDARGAPAVLFESIEELLLHLTLDAASGSLDSIWYWSQVRRIVPGIDTRRSRSILEPHARELPAIVHLAERRGLLGAFARALTEEEGATLISALAGQWGLGDIAANVRDAVQPEASTGPSTVAASPVDSRRGDREAGREGLEAEPVASSGEPPSLQRASHLPCEPENLTVRRAAPGASPAVRTLLALALAMARAPGSRLLAERVVRETLAPNAIGGGDPRRNRIEGRVEPPVSSAAVAPPPPPKNRAGDPDGGGPPETPNHIEGAVGDRSQHAEPAAPASATSQLVGDEIEPVIGEGDAGAAPEGTQVGLAGVFFLIRLIRDEGAALAAETPGGGWPVFRAIAWRLAGYAHRGERRWRVDPVWGLLETLAGDEWPDVGRLPVLCARRFGRQFRRKGRDNDAFRPLLRRILARPAGIRATRTHLDVDFRLDQADVELRRSGLDLNPGWMPWLGRVISFHYA